MPGSVQDLTRILKTAIDSEGNVQNMDIVVDVVVQLEKLPVTADDLKVTRLGYYINLIRRNLDASHKSLAKRLKKLVRQWQQLLQNRTTPNGRPPPPLSQTQGAQPPSQQQLGRTLANSGSSATTVDVSKSKSSSHSSVTSNTVQVSVPSVSNAQFVSQRTTPSPNSAVHASSFTPSGNSSSNSRNRYERSHSPSTNLSSGMKSSMKMSTNSSLSGSSSELLNVRIQNLHQRSQSPTPSHTPTPSPHAHPIATTATNSSHNANHMRPAPTHGLSVSTNPVRNRSKMAQLLSSVKKPSVNQSQQPMSHENDRLLKLHSHASHKSKRSSKSRSSSPIGSGTIVTNSSTSPVVRLSSPSKPSLSKEPSQSLSLSTNKNSVADVNAMSSSTQVPYVTNHIDNVVAHANSLGDSATSDTTNAPRNIDSHSIDKVKVVGNSTAEGSSASKGWTTSSFIEQPFPALDQNETSLSGLDRFLDSTPPQSMSEKERDGLDVGVASTARVRVSSGATEEATSNEAPSFHLSFPLGTSSSTGAKLLAKTQLSSREHEKTARERMEIGELTTDSPMSLVVRIPKQYFSVSTNTGPNSKDVTLPEHISHHLPNSTGNLSYKEESATGYDRTVLQQGGSLETQLRVSGKSHDPFFCEERPDLIVSIRTSLLKHTPSSKDTSHSSNSLLRNTANQHLYHNETHPSRTTNLVDCSSTKESQFGSVDTHNFNAWHSKHNDNSDSQIRRNTEEKMDTTAVEECPIRQENLAVDYSQLHVRSNNSTPQPDIIPHPICRRTRSNVIPLGASPGIDGYMGEDGLWYDWTDTIPNKDEAVTVLPYIYIDGFLMDDGEAMEII